MRKYQGADCKWKFETRADAKRARRAIYGKRQQHKGGPLSIYRCDDCGFYHLGHMPQRVRNGEIDRRDWQEAIRVRD